MSEDNRLVFAVTLHEGDPLILVGIPAGAWEYMQDGKTNHFDLTKAGLPVKFMLFGGATRAECLKAIETHNARQGIATSITPGEDYSIKGAG